MSLLSDTGRLRQVYRGSTEFFLVNSCGFLHSFPQGHMYSPVSPGHSSERGPHHPVRSSSLWDDSLEELFPPIFQVTLGQTGRGTCCTTLSQWLQQKLSAFPWQHRYQRSAFSSWNCQRNGHLTKAILLLGT